MAIIQQSRFWLEGRLPGSAKSRSPSEPAPPAAASFVPSAASPPSTGPVVRSSRSSAGSVSDRLGPDNGTARPAWWLRAGWLLARRQAGGGGGGQPGGQGPLDS